MSNYSSERILEKMKETGVIPVFYHDDIEVCKLVMQACYEGGINVFEFTNRGKFALENFKQLIKISRDHYKNFALGIGSVVDADTTKEYIKAGADFIVSPLINEEMATVCKQEGTSWMPGCGTVSEIYKAEQLGATIMKVFPASSVGGPGFVKAVKAPMPWLKIMPTGGVSTEEENLRAWFQAGVHCVGIGSKLVAVKNGKVEFDQLKEKVKTTLQIIKQIKDEI